MGSIGWMELVLIFIVVMLIFGGKKIPELARGLGEGIRSFKDSLRGDGPGDNKDKPQ